ncbi:acyl-CoA thioesterase [Hyphococcus sp.]|jgi:acyl-CoA thioester hydrolase|uniref:acyl-CoA thioesterase n=1 Tax=Hyphococcus sp. TaxID=2038636 RepID=UPI003D127616
MTADLTLSGNLAGARSYETAVAMTRRAEAAHIDELGHVNNAVYLIWAQDAGTVHWRAVATPKMQEELVWVALRHEIDYRDQVVEGETVEVRTWLGPASGPRFIRHIDIRKPGAARFSAKVETTWCLIDAKTRKPKRVTPEILDLFGVEAA